MDRNITDIAFEQIKDNYHWGKYGDFKVIIDTSTGYINASHLCGLALSKNGQPKLLGDWKRYNNAQELLNEISASMGIPIDKLMTIPVNLPNEIRGTYVHPDLIPHIASWASPKFAVRVSKIVNAHMVREAVAEKDKLLGIQRDKIDVLTEEIRKQSLQIQELLDLNHEIKDQNNELLDTTKDLEIINTETENKLEVVNTNIVNIAAKLGVAVQTRVPPMAAGDREVFKIYARNLRAGARVDEFKVLRRQERTFPTAFRVLARDGYTELIAEIYPTPNSVDTWNRMKKHLQSLTRSTNPQVYRVVGNSFSIRVGGDDALTRADVAKILIDIDNERGNI